MTGKALCLECKYRWEGVAPVGSYGFECPNCGLMKGVFKNLCLPEKEWWECNCGCEYFAITPTHAYCCYCGLAQEFP